MSCLFASSVFAATVTTTPEEDAFTQATAQKQNEAYDKSHGYANEGVRKTQQERSEEGWKEIHPDGKQPTQRERAEAGWKNQKDNEAVDRDKQTQAEAVKANREYD
ncbi:MAG: hypothetical protein IJV12_04630, partial [Acidaminococcaceae bacterium]|nr:hypothetical protein [Acidaminococcaceae bacterium]